MLKSSSMTYKFYIRAGRGASTPKSMLEQAVKQSEAFFGNIDFRLDVEVTGKQNDWQLECQATSLEVPDGQG